MESSSAETKQMYRSIYGLVKILDEERPRMTSVKHIFNPEISIKRKNLIDQCRKVMLHDTDVIGKKCREILWRKGFYEYVGLAKQQWRKEGVNLSEISKLSMTDFLNEAIAYLKATIVLIEREFNLNLRYTIDFTKLIDEPENDLNESYYHNKESLLNGNSDADKSQSIADINYALDTIHSLLISCGDLHRYFLDFNMQWAFDDRLETAFERAHHFYYEAFKLNPKLGMAHNQLGNLNSGRLFNLATLYHYVYSLTCEIPFELSENNLNKLLIANADRLDTPEAEELSLNRFCTQFTLIVDIFFYDKYIAELNDLCYAVLIDFHTLLADEERPFTKAILIKVVSTLFVCLSKLRFLASPKVHNLNALLVAICSELIDACIRNFKTFSGARVAEAEAYDESYAKLYGMRARSPPKASTSSQSQPDVVLCNGKKSMSGDGGGSSGANTQPSQRAKKVGGSTRRRRKRNQSVSDHSDVELTDFSDDEDENEDDLSELGSNSDEYEDDEDGDDDEQEQEEEEEEQNEKVAGTLLPEQFLAKINKKVIAELFDLDFKKLNFSSDNEDTPNLATQPIAKQSHCESVDVRIVDAPPKSSDRHRDKRNPNMIGRFVVDEVTLPSIKIIFDWLKMNGDILVGCYQTNPEFIHKIMELLNQLNIDVFSRKMFDCTLLEPDLFRDDFKALFNVRATIPTAEDVGFKNFDIFRGVQEPLDWETTKTLSVTDRDEGILRICKLVDFGLALCKMRKFDYRFCVRNRMFSVVVAREWEKTRTLTRRDRRIARASAHGKKMRELSRRDAEPAARKSAEVRRAPIKEADDKRKNEIMGKLWLRSEVKSLESKTRKPINVHLTPYIMVDAKALTEHTTLVKNLVKSRKFVALIPNAVLSELDDLKKHSEGARNVIRWLEHELSKGNRFLRSQRVNEDQLLPLMKIPKKLDREGQTIVSLAQFANYIISQQQHQYQDQSASVMLLTLLTGDNLRYKKSPLLNYAGILDAIPVKFEQISTFYAKYKKR